ncbi:MAG: hypothetical protein ACI9HK_004728 [Pirellulaceae bacterium]|jgi:hypothetical protein
MSNATQELVNKIATAKQRLESTLKKCEEVEMAVIAAEEVLEERRKAVGILLKDEGNLRGTIGELEKMQSTFEAAPEERSNR